MGYDSLSAQKDGALLLKIGKSDIIVIVFIWHIQQKLYDQMFGETKLFAGLSVRYQEDSVLSMQFSYPTAYDWKGQYQRPKSKKTSADFLMLRSS